jgi:photosystem II stability/assembly factor-like uncharacterized protein
MKRKTTNLLLRVALFTLILCLGTGVALAIGETTGLALADLSDASIEAIIRTPQNSTFYAALGGDKPGIYRSDDYGRSWQRINQGPGAVVNTLAAHPVDKQLLYASTRHETSGSRLWYSEDGGQNWHEIELDLPANNAGQQPVISTLVTDLNNPDVLYVGTVGAGLYRVRPEQAQSEPVGDEAMQQLYVKDVVISPNNQLYVVATEGLFLVDGNSSQKIESLPDAAVSLVVDPAEAQRLYAGTVGYGVYLSEDGGRTWQSLNAGLGWQPGIILRVPAIAIDETNPKHLALATAYGVGSQVLGEGIYESFNAGEHWVKIAKNSDVVKNLFIEAGGVYVATPNGLARYGDPLPAAPLASSLQFNSLAHPTGVQVLILALTLALAGWVLLGHLSWIPGYQSLT